MYDVIKTETVQEQIDNIVDYMISEFANVNIAIEFLSDIDDAACMISRYPQIGKEYEPEEKLEKTYRIKRVKNCKLFYTIDEDKKEIYIAYIFHDLQDVLIEAQVD